MKSAQVTIKDIAKELGISPSTVSRALKDHPDISPATKKAVNKLAQKWHYEPILSHAQRKELLYDAHHSSSIFHINLLQLNSSQDLQIFDIVD